MIFPSDVCQIIERAGRLPDHVVACVGRGANAIGIFQSFFGDAEKGRVNLVGVEAGGKGSGALNSAATLAHGSPGVLYGTRTYLLQVISGERGPACCVRFSPKWRLAVSHVVLFAQRLQRR